MNSIFLGLEERINYVYTEEQKQRLGKLAGLSETTVFTPQQLMEAPQRFAQTQWIFSTWGMPALTPQQLAALPALKGVFYAAGSVQGFARGLLQQGVRVFSAWQANAVPVAEFTVSQVLLANKGYFSAMRLHSTGRRAEGLAAAEQHPGNYGCKVGVIAAGQIGRMVIRALSARQLQVLVYDPFLSEAQAAELGAQKVGLEQLFRECQTVTNHLPNLPTTQKMLTYPLFASMKPNATFINTGRGAQVDEAGLIRALQECPQRTALIDVTDPEILPEDHIFYRMPNVLLTPHIAGSMNDEVHRMADYMLEEYARVAAGEPTRYEVTLPMLETMA